MYDTGRRIFDESHLVDIYKGLCSAYGLPRDEAIEVARELESHTGIILNSSFQCFEFSHLSLQEYLAADYIVREASQKSIPKYLGQVHAPVAVAISISSNPSKWFASWILESDWFEGLMEIYADNFNGFLARVVVEKPRFRVDELFGVTVAKSLSHPKIAKSAALDFLALPNVSESVSNFLSHLAYFKESEVEEFRRKDLVPVHLYGGVPPGSILQHSVMSPIAPSIVSAALVWTRKPVRVLSDNEVERWLTAEELDRE